MPRKQNGFGSSKSFAVKGIKSDKAINDSLTRGLKPKAAGSYPSNRTFGSTVSRTVIERYDAESDWIVWRKGYEYYIKAAFERLISAAPLSGSPQCKIGDICYNPSFAVDKDPNSPNYNPQYVESELNTQLYLNTSFTVDINFYGWRFSTRDSDSANHYVMKRTATMADNTTMELCYVTEPQVSGTDAAEAAANNEFWTKVTLGKDREILARSVGDRLTDGQTEATLTYFLNEKKEPALYTGKTVPPDLTEITVIVDYNDAVNTQFIQDRNGDIRAYIGEIGILPTLYSSKKIFDVTSSSFVDGPYYFNVKVDDELPNPYPSQEYFSILDNTETNLPPSLYDIAELQPIFVTNNFAGNIKGNYTYQKSDYQKFFGQTYLTAQMVEDRVTDIAYPTLPFLIKDVRIKFKNLPQSEWILEITAEPYLSTLDLYSVPDQGQDGYLVFADYSFTETMLDTYDGEYYHPIKGPYDTVKQQLEANNEFSKLVWYRKVNDIDPYVGYISEIGTLKPVFNNPSAALSLAEVYSCSCPSYSQAQLRMPQTTQGPEQRKVNRQRNYPLPTALGRKDYESVGLDSAAGVMQSWQNNRAAASYKLCKHVVASMYDEHLKLQEPNTYQSVDAREEFGRKLSADIKEVPKEFYESYARGGINTLEIVFALSQGLNYNEIEIASLVLNAKF